MGFVTIEAQKPDSTIIGPFNALSEGLFPGAVVLASGILWEVVSIEWRVAVPPNNPSPAARAHIRVLGT